MPLPPSAITLRVALVEVPVPTAAAPAIVDAFDDTFLDAMIDNPSLSAAVLTKHARSMAPGELDKLIYQGRPEVLDGILASPENRSAVLDSVLGAYELSSADLARLGARRLPQKVCDTLLYSYRADLAETCDLATLLANSSADARLQRVAKSDADDATLFALLEASAPAVRSLMPLISVLLRRRALRALAIESEVAELVAAACWCELPPELHERAADKALALSPPASLARAHNPVVGLLNQPTLVLTQRRRLEDYLHTNKELLSVPSAATRGLSAVMAMTATPIAARTQGFDLDALITSATRSAYGPTELRYVAITTSLLFELAKNPHLTPNQTFLVTRALLRHHSVISTPRNLALFDALVELITRIDADSTAGRYVTKHTKDHARYVNDPILAAFGKTYETSVANPHYRNRVYYQAPTTEVDWHRLLTTPIGSLTLDAALGPLGPYLQDALGDGATDVSATLWRHFFELIVENNAQTVPSLVDVATTAPQPQPIPV